jgi:hypothetical protein
MPTCTARTQAAASNPHIVRAKTMQTLLEMLAGAFGAVLLWAFFFALFLF